MGTQNGHFSLYEKDFKFCFLTLLSILSIRNGWGPLGNVEICQDGRMKYGSCHIELRW